MKQFQDRKTGFLKMALLSAVLLMSMLFCGVGQAVAASLLDGLTEKERDNIYAYLYYEAGKEVLSEKEVGEYGLDNIAGRGNSFVLNEKQTLFDQYSIMEVEGNKVLLLRGSKNHCYGFYPFDESGFFQGDGMGYAVYQLEDVLGYSKSQKGFSVQGAGILDAAYGRPIYGTTQSNCILKVTVDKHQYKKSMTGFIIRLGKKKPMYYSCDSERSENKKITKKQYDAEYKKLTSDLTPVEWESILGVRYTGSVGTS